MTKRSTALTAAAGEHYVAYRLSQLGYAVALTRGGAPVIDLMVANRKGEAVSVQVKTSSDAHWTFKRDPTKNYWNWDVGEKAKHSDGESLFYAFVDLKGSVPGTSPDVFVVPAKDVATQVKAEEKRITFSIMETDKALYFEKWGLITNRLETATTGVV